MLCRLRTLLIADVNVGVGLSLLSLAVIGVGVFFILTPAPHLLQSDHRTGRLLYESEMKLSGDKKRAIASAASFYRLFGGVLVAFGLAILLLAWLPIKSN